MTMLALLLTLTTTSTPPSASLWDHVRRAKLIALATVETADGSTAHLHVKELWVGGSSEVLDVRYNSGPYCAVPEIYEVGSEVVVFLWPLDTVPERVVSEPTPPIMWASPYARSTRVVHNATEREAMRRGVALAKLSDEYEWATYAFDSLLTRSDATKILGSKRTSKRVLEELEQGFIREPSHDELLVSSMALLRSRRSKELDRAFAAAIERVEDPEVRKKAAKLYAERL